MIKMQKSYLRKHNIRIGSLERPKNRILPVQKKTMMSRSKIRASGTTFKTISRLNDGIKGRYKSLSKIVAPQKRNLDLLISDVILCS